MSPQENDAPAGVSNQTIAPAGVPDAPPASESPPVARPEIAVTRPEPVVMPRSNYLDAAPSAVATEAKPPDLIATEAAQPTAEPVVQAPIAPPEPPTEPIAAPTTPVPAVAKSPPAEQPIEPTQSASPVVQEAAAPTTQAPVTPVKAPFQAKSKLRLALVIVGGLIIISALVVVGITLSKRASAQGHQHDAKVQADLQSLKGYLGTADTAGGSFPTLKQLNDPGWRAMHMQGVIPVALSPNGSVLQLVSGSPTDDAYAYNPSPAGCDGTKQSICSSYNLASKLSTGKPLTMSP